MKVKALLLCLALVPLVVAQPTVPVTAEPEEEPSIFDNFWSMMSNFFSGRSDVLTDRLQKGIDLVNTGFTKIGEVVDEFSIDVDVPEPKIKDAAEIVANITARLDQIKADADARLQALKEQVMNLDPFDLMDSEEEHESEPESEPTPTPEDEAVEDNWWPW